MKSILVLWVAGTALAGVNDTLAQREGWAAYAEALNAKVKAVNDACGSKLTAAYDPDTYPSFDPLTDRTQSACQTAVGTLSALCTTAAGKESVRALSSATCRYSTSGTGVKRDGARLFVKVDPERTAIVGLQPGSYSWASAFREIL